MVVIGTSHSPQLKGPPGAVLFQSTTAGNDSDLCDRWPNNYARSDHEYTLFTFPALTNLDMKCNGCPDHSVARVNAELCVRPMKRMFYAYRGASTLAQPHELPAHLLGPFPSSD